MGRRAVLRVIALVMAWLPGRARAEARAESAASPARSEGRARAESAEKPPIRWLGHW